ncbi:MULTISPECIES: hypothetical protein [Pseudomonas]|uniref:hypothetical protein n=1 Tax=Pseudomonas TaxID=286 RepID=UPI00155DB72D|nr:MULTISPECIES: hypothetical protein [Pseudomonas]WHV80751.1 hypothetical protein M2I96_31520 [Pseudomonas aeruginosa]WRH86039.1 hypothetical protein RDJ20_32975 [Pseudomonas aeruginosa]HCF1756629.1 hypothetical protein [Pseudomonas aeruginosa]HCF1760539.1 hypothetical protein [Pseudomonas aeruginosa]
MSDGFSLLAPVEVSTSGIGAVEVNCQHNEASNGFKQIRAFFDVILQSHSSPIFGNEPAGLIKKNQWLIGISGPCRGFSAGNLATDIWL